MLPTLRHEEFEEKVNCYNNHLSEWSLENGVSVIKCQLSFKLGTGEVDNLCYHTDHEHSGIFLNRYGVIRLMSILSKQCDGFAVRENWNEIRRTNDYENFSNFTSQKQGVARQPFKDVKTLGNLYQSRERHRTTPYIIRNSTQNHNRYSNSFRRENRVESMNENRNGIENVRERGRGCLNCGELNHRVNSCRFDHRLKCGNCYRLGHKSKLCRYFTN